MNGFSSGPGDVSTTEETPALAEVDPFRRSAQHPPAVDNPAWRLMRVSNPTHTWGNLKEASLGRLHVGS